MSRDASTLSACLEALGVTKEALIATDDVEGQFKLIRKCYMQLCLKTHPDKGGSEEAFGAVNDAWEALKSAFEAGRVASGGFACYFEGSGKQEKSQYVRKPRYGPMPSYDWFAAAADEPVPPYKVEPAASGRSKCTKQDGFIPKGELRFGSLDAMSGAYGRWSHLHCMRVPSLIWLGLPDPPKWSYSAEAVKEALLSMQALTLSGFSELNAEQQDAFVHHVMDPGNWARETKNSRIAHAWHNARARKTAAGAGAGEEAEEEAEEEAGTSAAAAAGAAAGAGAGTGAAAAPGPLAVGALAPSQALVPVSTGGAGRSFIVPRPGVGNAQGASHWKGRTFVLTGIFPELGGGAGLDLGKDRCRALIESFGGRVTGSVSGKTNFLVVGQEPGASKVGQARARGVKLVDVMALKAELEGAPGASLEAAPAPVIGSFSAGYNGNSVAYRLGPAAVAALMLPQYAGEGAAPPQPAAKAGKPAKARAAAVPRARKAPAARGRKRTAAAAESDDEEDPGSEDWQPPVRRSVRAGGRKRQRYGSDDDY
ncbi:hypothetical protein HYH03_016205 [Edaphochlamys debaryana]|uniref:Uncharacterized protein n=1 Tax=Edaphochlamys debaryana TaxID=47281 RepID=A0A835XKQ1_9CHLO|nr:hypothetical protein HYH03_016205 [Edaphochlamys debaryana]|eukprot:KAG2485002.1 hypothetical protein HYH03_016205 [Edaphochlamys debaryana]